MAGTPFDTRFRAMGSDCEIKLYAPEEAQALAAFEVACEEIDRLEAKYSRYRTDSVVSFINRTAGGAPVTVDEETAGLLDYAHTCYQRSGGQFDITSGVLQRVWDFSRDAPPEAAAVAKVLPLVGWEKATWESPRFALLVAGMEIDLGGVVKEYAADKAATALQERGFHHGLINLGGDVRVLGPQADGSPWRIGLRHPRRPEALLGTVAVRQGGLATSGDYERYIEVNGVRFSHILDPHSGWPSRGLQAVSVLAGFCLVAGSAATMAMLKPEQEGLQFLEGLGLPYVAVDRSGQVKSRLALTAA